MKPRAAYFAHATAPLAQTQIAQASELFSTQGWDLVDGDKAVDGAEFALVLGGDGTLLRAAEQLRGRDIPICGINLGHMGFLAEADSDDLPAVIDHLVKGDYRVEDRATVAAVMTQPDGHQVSSWALNEVTLEKASPHLVIEVMVSVDSRPLSTFGCDGIVLSTPTGSTGHAFSGGGPVVWPEVEALLMVPLSAHALFARPLVVSPSTVISIDILADSRSDGEVSFDARRVTPLRAGGRLEVRHSSEPVRLIRFAHASFADRLVQKFALPVAGWRGQGRDGGR